MTFREWLCNHGWHKWEIVKRFPGRFGGAVYGQCCKHCPERRDVVVPSQSDIPWPGDYCWQEAKEWVNADKYAALAKKAMSEVRRQANRLA